MSNLATAPAGYSLSPYCGAPPAPASLASQWNLDPILIAVLFAVLGLYLWMSHRRSRLGAPMARPARASFFGGWALGALALISPLCPLSVSLFSARIGQHMLLTCVVAPLIALGLPRVSSLSKGGGAFPSAALFAGFLWFWHAPAPYLATFRSDAVYWAMHLSLFFSALWLWRSVLVSRDQQLGSVLAAAAFTTLQMGLLGAAITFAAHALYAPHVLTTAAWGLSPLQDQQLGGVIMWVPAGIILVAALVGGMAVAMRRADGSRALVSEA